MKQRFSVIVASILGAFCLYCGQSALQKPDGGKFVGAAKGESSSQPATAAGVVTQLTPQTFVKLAEGDVNAVDDSPVIPVGAYREVVVYFTTGECQIDALFRATPKDPFGLTGQSLGTGGRLRVDGSDLRLQSRGCSQHGVHFVVAAVQ